MPRLGGGDIITGNVTINTTQLGPNSVTDKEVTRGSLRPQNTNLITVGKNLVNPAEVVNGYYVNSGNGNLAANAGYLASGFIPVTPGLHYTTKYKRFMAWYDVTKAYISGVAGTIDGLTWDGTATYITAPENAAYARFSINAASATGFQAEQADASTFYEPYYTQSDKLRVSTLNIVDSAVTADKVAFLKTGKNLVDPSKITDGYYVANNSGILANNAVYCASGYIPVTPGLTYATNYPHQMAWYDSNKVYISGNVTAGSNVAPANAAYGRWTGGMSSKSTWQIEQNTISTAYEAYGYVLNPAKPSDQTTPDVLVYLPSEICVAVGRTIEIYNKQVCWSGDYSRLHFKWTCTKGKSLQRKYSCKAASGDVGSYTLSLTVYNPNMVAVASATTTLKIVNIGTAPSPAKKMLCIGDSLTNGKPWMAEWDSLANTAFGGDVIEFVGTRGSGNSKHEGRSGWAASSYLADTAYSYEGTWQFTVSGVTENPEIGKKYTVPTLGIAFVTAVDITAGSGTINLKRDAAGSTLPDATGTMTEVVTDGAGDASIAYSAAYCVERNPFWNSGTGAVDFANYSTVTGITPDAVQLFLGTNGIALDATTNTANIKALIDAMRTSWPNIPIYLVNTIYRSNQDGYGVIYGAGGAYMLEENRKVYNLAVALKTALSAYTKIYYVPCILIMDCEYGFGQVPTAVNPRSSVTVDYPVENVHPQNDGYLQMADSMYSTWLAHYADA